MKKNILIIVILTVICCLGIEVYNLSRNKTPVVDTETTETETTETDYIIEGLYSESVEAGDPPTYVFYDDEVIWDGYETYYGKFEIKGNKLVISYTSGRNIDGDEIELTEEKTEEFTIIDNNTLQYNDTKIIKETGYEDVVLSGLYSFEEAGDAGWEFTEDGRVAYSTNMSVSYGEYKTIGLNAILIHYTKDEIWDDDGNVGYRPTDNYEYCVGSDKSLDVYFPQTYSFEKIVHCGNVVNIKENKELAENDTEISKKILEDIEKQLVDNYLTNKKESPIEILDYEIDEITFLSTEQRKEIEEMFPEYKDKELLLKISYYVKTKDGVWAGDAESIDEYKGEKNWSKAGFCATYDDGVLECFTGW